MGESWRSTVNFMGIVLSKMLIRRRELSLTITINDHYLHVLSFLLLIVYAGGFHPDLRPVECSFHLAKTTSLRMSRPSNAGTQYFNIFLLDNFFRIIMMILLQAERFG